MTPNLEERGAGGVRDPWDQELDQVRACGGVEPALRAVASDDEVDTGEAVAARLAVAAVVLALADLHVAGEDPR